MASICLPPDPLLFLGGPHKLHCATPCMQVSPVAGISPLKLKPQTDTNLHSGKSVGHQESTFVQRSSFVGHSHSPRPVSRALESEPSCNQPSSKCKSSQFCSVTNLLRYLIR